MDHLLLFVSEILISEVFDNIDMSQVNEEEYDPELYARLKREHREWQAERRKRKKKEWREKNPDYTKNWERNLRAQCSAIISDLLGDVCLICDYEKGSNKRALHSHYIPNGKHPKLLTKRGIRFLKENINDFVRLCQRCHMMVHTLHGLGKTWDEIIKFIN